MSLTVPVADTTRRTEHGVVVDWDEAEGREVFRALRDSNTEPIRTIAEARRPAGRRLTRPVPRAGEVNLEPLSSVSVAASIGRKV